MGIEDICRPLFSIAPVFLNLVAWNHFHECYSFRCPFSEGPRKHNML